MVSPVHSVYVGHPWLGPRPDGTVQRAWLGGQANLARRRSRGIGCGHLDLVCVIERPLPAGKSGGDELTLILRDWCRDLDVVSCDYRRASLR
jgi:hypothetical protein